VADMNFRVQSSRCDNINQLLALPVVKNISELKVGFIDVGCHTCLLHLRIQVRVCYDIIFKLQRHAIEPNLYHLIEGKPDPKEKWDAIKRYMTSQGFNCIYDICSVSPFPKQNSTRFYDGRTQGIFENIVLHATGLKKRFIVHVEIICKY
jgi:hypothetical protein